MNGYLFVAGVTQSQVRPTPLGAALSVDSLQTWDSCISAILCGDDPIQAQKRFEAWCRSCSPTENPVETEIKKVVAAQFVDLLLTESGNKPLDWLEISAQVYAAVQETIVEDFEQGYWVDINRTVSAGSICQDIESLQGELPEDVRSALNWSSGKQFYFLVSVLSPSPASEALADEIESHTPNRYGADDETEVVDQSDLGEFVARLPELRDKETAVLVMARNSVVAAWLWRTYAADTRLAENEIQIGPCCDFLPVE